MNCSQCQALTINGVYCHEIGCPDAWKDDRPDCMECGCQFVPENRLQVLCNDNCAATWYGIERCE